MVPWCKTSALKWHVLWPTWYRKPWRKKNKHTFVEATWLLNGIGAHPEEVQQREPAAAPKH